MTETIRNGSVAGDRSENRPDLVVRWMCPYCGHGREAAGAIDAEVADAKTALRSHISASTGDGHGPSSELPEDDALRIAHHVIVDAGDRPGPELR